MSAFLLFFFAFINPSGTAKVKPEPTVTGRIGRGKNKKYGDDFVTEGVNKSQNSRNSNDCNTVFHSANIDKTCSIDNASFSTTDILSCTTATTNVLSYAAATAQSPLQSRTPTSLLSKMTSKNRNLDFQEKGTYKISSHNGHDGERNDIHDSSSDINFRCSEDPDTKFCQRPGDGGLVKG
jgi:hypothetical protein